MFPLSPGIFSAPWGPLHMYNPQLLFRRNLSCCFFCRQLRGTVRTSYRLDGNLTLAERALLGGGGCRNFRLLAQRSKLVHRFQQAEQHKCHDQEIHQRRNKVGGEFGNVLKRIVLCSCNKVQDRVDKVISQGSYDVGEGAADDNTDCHVHHIAAQGKCLKLF